MPGTAIGCPICALPPDDLAKVNKAIWTSDRLRRRGFVASSRRALGFDRGEGPAVAGITGHADHTEAEWVLELLGDAPAEDDKPVASEESLALSVRLGAKAAAILEAKMARGFVEDRVLVMLHKIGVGAAVAQQRHEEVGNAPQLFAQALMGVVSGHLAPIEGEVRNVTPINTLMDGLREERNDLMQLAGHTESQEDEVATDEAS